MTDDELAEAWERALVLERAVEEIERRSAAMVAGMRHHYAERARRMLHPLASTPLPVPGTPARG